MAQKTNWLVLAIITLFQINACGQMTYDEKLQGLYQNSVPLIQSDALMQDISKTSNNTVAPQGLLYILDIRSPKEYQISHLDGARMIDYDHFKKQDVQDIPKDAHIVVYCSVGYRSERIGEKLLKMGYAHVNNLYGGIFQWVNEGNPVVDTHSQATDSVHTYNKDWSKWLKKGIKVYE